MTENAKAAMVQFRTFRDTGRVGRLRSTTHKVAKVLRDLAVAWGDIPDICKAEVGLTYHVDDKDPAKVRISLIGPPE